jgi:hypothetical protein
MTNSHKWLTIVPHIRPSGDSSKADIPNSQLSKDEEFTMSEKAQVYVVDPDVEARTIFRSFSATLGVPVSDCASASDFLSYDLDTISGCLVIDSWLPDMDGVTLLRRKPTNGRESSRSFRRFTSGASMPPCLTLRLYYAASG